MTPRRIAELAALGVKTMWNLDKSCVTVKPVDRPCPECGDFPITHFVELDMGSQTVSVFEGCELCADDFALRMKDALPPNSENAEEMKSCP